MYDNLTRTNLEFAYQKAEKRIEELETENAGLREKYLQATDEGTSWAHLKSLERELENERKLNAEIKARFVKCNTCTPDMKEKCPMFHENLCEGERCEELVDLMSLVNKRDTDDKLDKAKEIIKALLFDLEQYFNIVNFEILKEHKTKARQFLEE